MCTKLGSSLDYVGVMYTDLTDKKYLEKCHRGVIDERILDKGTPFFDPQRRHVLAKKEDTEVNFVSKYRKRVCTNGPSTDFTIWPSCSVSG